jgi:hypothetical protein
MQVGTCPLPWKQIRWFCLMKTPIRITVGAPPVSSREMAQPSAAAAEGKMKLHRQG